MKLHLFFVNETENFWRLSLFCEEILPSEMSMEMIKYFKLVTNKLNILRFGTIAAK